MSFLDESVVRKFKANIESNTSQLGKIYKAKRLDFQTLSVDHSLVAGYLKDGWELNGEPLKTKTKIRKSKTHAKAFEDRVWCQFYELGFREMSFDENFILPFSKDDKDTKQIDVVAMNNEVVFLVECKSSEKPKAAPSYKDEFDSLGVRIGGFKQALEQAYGRSIKVKYIFATNNIRLKSSSADVKRLKSLQAFYYNDNTYSYINRLIKHYKKAAYYQFLGLVLKNELINNDKVEIPAVRGVMGEKSYYMFSIEPALLLKMGFILHRTRVNEAEFPTYQRLLVPSRLGKITKFIDDGGYFPNSIILNFNTKKNKLLFESSSKCSSSSSCFGTLKIPNSYAMAYIIDGQHRVYGYANSEYKDNNTIPVVAFDGLSSKEQLEIFMDINQNQKAVSPSLRKDLEEDLYWGSDRFDSRLKALRSSIIKVLNNETSSPLLNKISVGADSALLSFEPFDKALIHSNLLPTAKGNKCDATKGSLYDVTNHDYALEMVEAKKRVSDLIIECYEFAEQSYEDIFTRDKFFIMSNRGTYAYIALIGDLNKYESEQGNINIRSSSSTRLEVISKYLTVLLDYLANIPKDEEKKQLSLLGAGANKAWLRFFQSIINQKYPDYNPIELIDWKERQNEDLQNKGRKLGIEIEKKIKSLVVNKMKGLYANNWELEIGKIQRECEKRAREEMEKKYKEGLEVENIPWTEMFNITDYKEIIAKYWTKRVEDDNTFFTFEHDFSIDIGEDFNSKAQKLKWISYFNSYRNLWAHEGTKEKRLNRTEVEFLEEIHKHFQKVGS